MKRYLAIDIGASSGRHIIGTVQDGKIVLEEAYRFDCVSGATITFKNAFEFGRHTFRPRLYNGTTLNHEGGIFGTGIGNSTEKLTPLPEAETDFIFAIIGEELGLIGALRVIALFFVFLIAGLLIANESEDPFARMLAGSLTVMIVFQAFLNMGCVTGLLPTTGKPLPFISSGGTSMLATMIMVGLIMTAAPRGGKTSIYDKRRENLRIVRSADSSNARFAEAQPMEPRGRNRLPLDLPLGDNIGSRRGKTLRPMSVLRGRK